MNSFHSPLGLRARLQDPETRADALPLVTVLLLAILFTLAGSRFIYAPGLTMALGAAPDALEMPRSATPLPGEMTHATLIAPKATNAAADFPAHMLTATSDTLVFFNGMPFARLDSALQQAMANAVSKAKEEAAQRVPEGEKIPSAPVILLLKIDRSVTMQRFFQLSDYAREAGFSHVQVASEDRSPQ
ncbi:MAG: hypothetical protein LBV54_08680 [Puniceicoccales bacterium]|jgi:biopolymer transport protein ExbD|nr:hypothetical protein [Puniceicoccales bacterium]